MMLRTIQLTAKENNWRLFIKRKVDPSFISFAKKIWERDEYACQYCGFQAKEHQEVINLDNNYYNNRLNNLVTSCCLCAQCFFLEAVGKGDFGGGILIFLPEVTQAELNALCHVLFATLSSGSGTHDKTARNIYRSLKLRSQLVDQELGEGLSNPNLFGQILIDAYIENKPIITTELSKKLRLLPDMGFFVEKIESWTIAGLKALSY